MKLDDYVLLEHGVWIINNICVDSSESFDFIVKCQIDQRIKDIFNYNISLQCTRMLIFFFKNLHKFLKKRDLNFTFVR